MAEHDPYGLDPAFERAFVTMACSNPRFHARIGTQIDSALLADEAAKLAMQASQSISEERGNGPSSLNVVQQRLRRWFDEGKVTQEAINAVMDLFDDALDEGLPDEDDVVAEIVPILQHRIHGSVVRQAIETYGKRGDMAHLASILEKTQRLGQANESMGTDFDDAFEEIDKISGLERLPTGIIELDMALNGGFERGSEWIFMGGTGDGKSISLTQCAAEACLSGFNVCYATLEISKPRTLARLMSNMTGVPINGVLDGATHTAKERYGQIKDRLGLLRVEYFTPNVTTIGDIKAWVHRVEEKFGKTIHVVVIDYADRCTDPAFEKVGSYVNMLHVFEQFRVWMEAESKWGLTATAAKRKENKARKILDAEDGADSQNKARVCDGLITLNVKDGKEIVFFIAKNRNGEAQIRVGPLGTDWACARIAPTQRPFDEAVTDDRLFPDAYGHGYLQG